MAQAAAARQGPEGAEIPLFTKNPPLILFRRRFVEKLRHYCLDYILILPFLQARQPVLARKCPVLHQ